MGCLRSGPLQSWRCRPRRSEPRVCLCACGCAWLNSHLLSSGLPGLYGGCALLLHQWRGGPLSSQSALVFAEQQSRRVCFPGAARAAAPLEEVDAEPGPGQLAQAPYQLHQPQRLPSHAGLPAAVCTRQPGHCRTCQRCCACVTGFILLEGYCKTTAQMCVFVTQCGF